MGLKLKRTRKCAASRCLVAGSWRRQALGFWIETWGRACSRHRGKCRWDSGVSEILCNSFFFPFLLFLPIFSLKISAEFSLSYNLERLKETGSLFSSWDSLIAILSWCAFVSLKCLSYAIVRFLLRYWIETWQKGEPLWYRCTRKASDNPGALCCWFTCLWFQFLN